MLEANKLSLVEQAHLGPVSTNEVIARLKTFVEQGEVTLREIGRATDYSPSVISQVLGGSYAGDTEKATDAIARFYRAWLDRQSIVKTKTVTIITNIMDLIYKRRDIGLIVGRFGAGKTKAGTSYAAHNPKTSAFIDVKSTTSPAAILHRIGDALNITNLIGSQDDKLHTVIRNLQRNPRLLIIDEADNLKPRTLAIIKDVHGGEAAERCGIVLIGTERIKETLRMKELGYLESRIGIKQVIGDISFNEAEEIMDRWPHSLDREDKQEIYIWAMNHFSTRSLVKVMARSYDVMQMEGKRTIDVKCRDAALAMLAD
jgi:DNA transposition AAA+ family ATPase